MILENLKQITIPNKIQPTSIESKKSTQKVIETSLIKQSKSTKKAELKTNTNLIKKVLEWNESEVNLWLKDKKIHKNIITNISPCNGKLLHQLYNIKLEAPEFFYKSISSNKILPTVEILLFVSELTNLFSE